MPRLKPIPAKHAVYGDVLILAFSKKMSTALIVKPTGDMRWVDILELRLDDAWLLRHG